MTHEEQLMQKFSFIEWRKPIFLHRTDSGKPPALGCRFCIAKDGLKVFQIKNHPHGILEFSNHMREVHKLEADREIKLPGIPIPMQLADTKEIHDAGAMMIAAEWENCKGHLEIYPPGSKRGYFCADCGTELFVAPSGQEILAAGKNKAYCLPCIGKRGETGKQDSGENQREGRDGDKGS